MIHRPYTRRPRATSAPKARIQVEALEARVVPYAVSGDAWPNPELITISFVPDGTDLGGVKSNLFATMNAHWSTATWENQILKAAQVWAQQANINFSIIPDSGAPIGSGNYEQGDPTMGDIRIGGYNFGSSTLASAFLPPPVNNYSIAGDIQFNTGQVWNIGGGTYDLFTVAAHEFGHALGMEHSTNSFAVMYSTYTNRKTGLYSDDIAGIQSIYGARPLDQYDSNGPNNTFATAGDISSLINSSTLTASATDLDMAKAGEQHYFTFTAPSGTSSTIAVTVQSSGLSMLSPLLTVYAADQSTVLGTASGAGKYGATMSVTIKGVSPGERFYVKVTGADSTAFSTGEYALNLNFGTGSAPTEASASTMTAAGNSPQAGGGVPNGTDLPNNFLTSTLLNVTNVVADTVNGVSLNESAPSWDGLEADPSLAIRTVTTTSENGGQSSPPVLSSLRALSTLPLQQLAFSLEFAASCAGIPSSVSVQTAAQTPMLDVRAVMTIGSVCLAVPATVGGPPTTSTEKAEQDNNMPPSEDSPPELRLDVPDLGGPLSKPAMSTPGAWESTAPVAPQDLDSCFMDGFESARHVQGTNDLPADESPTTADPRTAAAGMVVLLGGWWRSRPGGERLRRRSQPADRRTGERRTTQRHGCFLDAFCRRVGASVVERFPAAASDLSARGINLLLRQPFQLDSLLTLELDGAGRGLSRLLLVRVKHIIEQAPGEWLMGCAFEEQLSNAEVQALLPEGVASPELSDDPRWLAAIDAD
jgi:hypothetical protein